MEENVNNTVPNVNNLLDVRQPVTTKDIIANIVNNVKEGNVNPLEAYTVLKRMAKVSEEVLKDEDIKALAVREFDKYTPEKKGTKTVNVFGAGITYSPTYTWYDFKGCKHEVLDALYEIQEQVKHQIGLIEAELKLLIPKDDYKAGVVPGLGIENTTKSVVFERLPSLVWEDYGIIGQIEPPKKVQNMGLKYMKL